MTLDSSLCSAALYLVSSLDTLCALKFVTPNQRHLGAFRLLKVMSNPNETMTREDVSSWSASVLTHPDYYSKYSWYKPEGLSWTFRESNTALEQNTRDSFWKTDSLITPFKQVGCPEHKSHLVAKL